MAVRGTLKKHTVVKPNIEYRKLQALNYSMLKLWDENPAMFLDQFKLGKARKNKSTSSSIIGDIAHFYVLDCGGSINEFENRIDDKFAQITYETGTKQVFILCDHLFDVTEENMDLEGNITMALEDRFELAVERVRKDEKYKGKDIDKIWDDFEKNGADYFQTRLANIGKTIVTPVQIEKGKFVGNTVLDDPFTSHVFKGNIHTSFPIEWIYDNNDCSKTVCKSEIDLLKIDDHRKKIYLYDLKCTWDNEGFESSYLRYYYYIQQAYYYLAAQYHFTHIDEKYEEYEIVPMQYVVADTSLNNRRPLIYPCSDTDLQAGLNGFKLGHRHYKGVHELMDEICFAETEGIWNISRDAYLKKGIMGLSFDYQINDRK